jgi:transposase
MNIHKNARLTPHGRAEVARRVREDGVPARQAAREAHTTEKTVRKWVARQEAGEPLEDRSSRPRGCPPTTAPAVALRVKVLRQRDRLTLTEIAAVVGISRATVGRIVARCGWSNLHVLEVPPTSRRYERAAPGDLVHIDIKKLARIVRPGHRISGNRRDTVRGAGWQYAHVAIDDHSRVGVRRNAPR